MNTVNDSGSARESESHFFSSMKKRLAHSDDKGISGSLKDAHARGVVSTMDLHLLQTRKRESGACFKASRAMTTVE